jgi:uncharacterized repeat protein (TIGR03803 family)
MRRVLFLLTFTAVSIAAASPAWAASEQVLYSFTGGIDGSDPVGGVVSDSTGNLYGVTYRGGTGKSGVVFKLSRASNGTWNEKVLYSFCPVLGCVDGANPIGGLAIDASGNLYGVTYDGGAGQAGVVFELTLIGDTWREIVLHHFCTAAGCADGAFPVAGLTFDGAGHLYGTTNSGGRCKCGVAFKISVVSGISGGWLETVLYEFCTAEYCPDGSAPHAGVTFDLAGNLYGTTSGGGSNYQGGTIYEMSPRTSGYWEHGALYDFCPVKGCLDGDLPLGGVTFDVLGNLYGTASGGGAKGAGVLFQLSPISGRWQYSIVHSFCADENSQGECVDGVKPVNGIIFDSAGNMYGTTQLGGTKGAGVVFELVDERTGWQENVLHTFCTQARCADGDQPSGTMIFGSVGELYGTTSSGGTDGAGVVFEITL